MTLKELDNEKISDSMKKQIINVATITHQKNGTPFERAIELVYNAYIAKPTLKY